MSFFDSEINLDDLPEGNTLIPADWYFATIIEADLRMTKAGTGQYIAIKYRIDGPSKANRTIYGNINIRNQNPTAEEIGKRDLGNLMRAIGAAKLRGTDDLLNKQLSIRITVRQNDQRGDENEIRGYKAIEGSPAPMPSAAKPAAKDGAMPPW